MMVVVFPSFFFPFHYFFSRKQSWIHFLWTRVHLVNIYVFIYIYLRLQKWHPEKIHTHDNIIWFIYVPKQFFNNRISKQIYSNQSFYVPPFFFTHFFPNDKKHGSWPQQPYTHMAGGQRDLRADSLSRSFFFLTLREKAKLKWAMKKGTLVV